MIYIMLWIFKTMPYKHKRFVILYKAVVRSYTFLLHIIINIGHAFHIKYINN